MIFENVLKTRNWKHLDLIQNLLFIFNYQRCKTTYNLQGEIFSIVFENSKDIEFWQFQRKILSSFIEN